jgi:hypothetical protein
MTEPTRWQLLVERYLHVLWCPNCLCLRFGPGHITRRILGVCGPDRTRR